MVLAVRIPSPGRFYRSSNRSQTTTSCPSKRASTGDEDSCAVGRNTQACGLSYHAALFRHASPRSGRRYSNRTRTSRAQRSEDDDDLHPCDEKARDRRPKPSGPGRGRHGTQEALSREASSPPLHWPTARRGGRPIREFGPTPRRILRPRPPGVSPIFRHEGPRTPGIRRTARRSARPILNRSALRKPISRFRIRRRG